MEKKPTRNPKILPDAITPSVCYIVSFLNAVQDDKVIYYLSLHNANSLCFFIFTTSNKVGLLSGEMKTFQWFLFPLKDPAPQRPA